MSGLNENVGEQEFKDRFRAFGTIVDTELVRDKQTGMESAHSETADFKLTPWISASCWQAEEFAVEVRISH